MESHPTEIKYPKQTEEFRRIMDSMYKTHLDKNQDYSPANIIVAGEIGVLIRIWDKFCRLCNLYGITFPAVGPRIDTLIEKIESEELSKEQTIEELKQLKHASEFDFNSIVAKQPKNESVEDAWLDLSNYSIIGNLKRKKAWGR